MPSMHPRGRQLRAIHTDARNRVAGVLAQAMAQRPPDNRGYVRCPLDEGMGKQIQEVTLLLDVEKPN